jgi:hypothetical protein
LRCLFLIQPDAAKTSSADCDMIAVLLDIVNVASQVAREVTHRVCCSATQTQHRQNQNHLQIRHDTTR